MYIYIQKTKIHLINTSHRYVRVKTDDGTAAAESERAVVAGGQNVSGWLNKISFGVDLFFYLKSCRLSAM